MTLTLYICSHRNVEICTVLNKSWKQYSIKQQLHACLPPIAKDEQHMLDTAAEERMNFFNGLLNIDTTYSVQTLNGVKRTYQELWPIKEGWQE